MPKICRVTKDNWRELIKLSVREDQGIGISYEPENEVARKLYADLGFIETGEMLGDEVLAVLKVR